MAALLACLFAARVALLVRCSRCVAGALFAARVALLARCSLLALRCWFAARVAFLFVFFADSGPAARTFLHTDSVTETVF